MCRVLYIDDDTNHGEFFREICKKKQNMFCDTVDNITDAKQRIETENYDVYITDFLLGEDTGLDIIEEYPNKKWFLITAVPEEFIDDDIKNNKHIIEILYKPISINHALETIDKYSVQRV